MQVKAGSVAAIVALTAAAPNAVADTPASGSVVVENQTTWVLPPTSTSSSTMVLTLAPSGSADAVDVAVFPRLIARSTLEADLTTPPTTGALGDPGPIAFSCLGTNPLRLVLTASASTSPGPGPCSGQAPPTVALSCSGTSCAGVYPVTLTALHGTTVLSRTTTFLTVAARQGVNPMRVALVLPFGLPGNAGQLSATRASALATTLAVAEHSPRVPLTLAPEPALVAALGPDQQGQAIRAELRASLRSPVHQLLSTTYVPIDPGSLLAANLRPEITHQRAAGTAALAAAGLAASVPTTYVEDKTGFLPSAAGIVAGGGRAVLVDSAALSPNPDLTFSWWQPFELQDPSGSQVPAVAIDDQLSAYSAASQRTPVLAAAQLLGDLAFCYFEAPGLPSPRGLVVLPQPDWMPDPNFLATTLHGLATNPVLDAVTLAGYSAQVAIGANGAPSVRSGTISTQASLTPTVAAAISEARSQLQSLGGTLVGAPSRLATLNGELLRSESLRFSPAEAKVALLRYEAAVTPTLRSVMLPADPITLTSSRGTLPITVESSAQVPLRVVVRLRSPRLQFPEGASTVLWLRQPTTTVRIEVAAETTGDLPLSITVTTPDGRVVLTQAAIVVRATATSVVAIVLTVVAVVVLAFWWIRTSRRNRAARRAAHG